MRLIDADALNKKLCETTIFIKDGEKFQRMINDSPAIEPDGDLISRRAAILAITGEPPEAHYPSWYAERIKALPSVQADGDLISRQNAVKEIDSFCGEVWTESEADFARGLGTALSIVESLPSAEQVTGKLNNPDNSLLTADSEACKEQKSKLDLISRQDAIEALMNDSDWADAIPTIESLPSAPDSRQQGKWTDGHGNEMFRYCHGGYCSVCGEESEDLTDYCGNCGAPMIVRDGEDE